VRNNNDTIFPGLGQCFMFLSVLRHCWLDNRKASWTAKSGF